MWHRWSPGGTRENPTFAHTSLDSLSGLELWAASFTLGYTSWSLVWRFFFFPHLLLFTLNCYWMVFQFPWNLSGDEQSLFFYLTAQLPKRKCRFLWFSHTFRIIQNEPFINALLVTYSGKQLSQIFGVPECFSWRKSSHYGGINDHLKYQNFPWMFFSHSNR